MVWDGKVHLLLDLFAMTTMTTMIRMMLLMMIDEDEDVVEDEYYDYNYFYGS